MMRIEANEFLKRYAAGERIFGGVNLHGVDIRGQDLRGVHLSNVNLYKARLDGSDLSGTVLNRVNLESSYLQGVKFHGASLGVNLNNANLNGTDFKGAFLLPSNFSNAFLEGADFRGAYLKWVNFSDAFLKGVDFRGAYLNSANFSNAILTGADLRGVDFTGLEVDFGEVDLRCSANFSNANLTGADLRGIDLSCAKLDQTILKGAVLDQTKMPDGVIFSSDGVVEYKEPVVRSGSFSESADENAVNNQGILFKPNWRIYTWQGLRFRSKPEIKIAEALDRAGVLFLPNCLARLNVPEQLGGRGNKEADFIVCYQGKWGILEVDGFYHKPERRVDEQERERLFRHYAIRVIERFDASRCDKQPDEVVREFLQMIEKMH